MIYNIENNFLKVKINSVGAEIVSIQYQNAELIWQAQQPWKRHAPILFPIIGKLKNNHYIYQNKIYSLPQHGFARDKEWICTLHSQTIAEFELTDDENTLAQYPFHFSLIIKYELINTQINITFTVFNPHHSDLPFSIGFHPAFNTFKQLNKCYLKFFPEKNSLKRTLLKDGLLSHQYEIIQLQQKHILHLNEELFIQDAIVLEHPEIQEIQLCCDDWYYQININGGNCTNWGIWTKNNCSEFICIEPWMGIADSQEIIHNNILHKKDIILLPPYQNFQWQVQISIGLL